MGAPNTSLGQTQIQSNPIILPAVSIWQIRTTCSASGKLKNCPKCLQSLQILILYIRRREANKCRICWTPTVAGDFQLTGDDGENFYTKLAGIICIHNFSGYRIFHGSTSPCSSSSQNGPRILASLFNYLNDLSMIFTWAVDFFSCIITVGTGRKCK